MNKNILWLFLGLLFFVSCNKEGRINIKINYQYSKTDPNQTISYSQTVVKLYKNGALLDAKMFDEQESNISFGVYEYGNDYSVDCSAKKDVTVQQGGLTTTNSYIVSSNENFSLKKKEKTFEVSLE